ncbi:MAG: ATP-binding protein [Campylobacterota bacterium]|nr:ATP-binding protein [Campylobacterota bacterium]
MLSPFPYETFAEDENFLGRDKELLLLEKYIHSSNNLVVYSKRRMGKSSLVKKSIKELSKENLCIYCDIFDITSEDDFGWILLNSLANSLKGDITHTIKKLASFFKRARVEPVFDPKSAQMSIKPIVKSLDFDEMLEDFFNTIFELSKKQNIVLVIDEFQQISTIKNIKIDAKLRKYMQENKNISYIFLGSKRHMLNKLFEYKAPLFEMATPLNLEPLSIEDIYNYVKKYLDIDSEQMQYIYNLADKETKLIQHILHILYKNYQDKNIDEDKIDLSLKEIIDAKSSAYRIIYDTFSQNQKKAFKLLSKYGKNFYSKDILDEQNLTKTAMHSALKQLFDKEFIDKEDDRWFIPDRAFEIWGKSLS